MKFPTIEVGKFRRKLPYKKNSYAKTQPFVIVFVYAKEGNFVVKGMEAEVTTYISQRFPYSFYNYSFWKNGQRASLWSKPKELKLYITSEKVDGRRKYIFSMQTKDGWKGNVLACRNMPKRWIPLFDQALLVPSPPSG